MIRKLAITLIVVLGIAAGICGSWVVNQLAAGRTFAQGVNVQGLPALYIAAFEGAGIRADALVWQTEAGESATQYHVNKAALAEVPGDTSPYYLKTSTTRSGMEWADDVATKARSDAGDSFQHFTATNDSNLLATLNAQANSNQPLIIYAQNDVTANPPGGSQSYRTGDVVTVPPRSDVGKIHFNISNPVAHATKLDTDLSNVGTVAEGDQDAFRNAIGAGSTARLLLVAEKTLTTSQIRGLQTTPVELIPAPPDGKMHLVERVLIDLRGSSGAWPSQSGYAGEAAFDFQYASGDILWGEASVSSALSSSDNTDGPSTVFWTEVFARYWWWSTRPGAAFQVKGSGTAGYFATIPQNSDATAVVRIYYWLADLPAPTGYTP